MLRNAQLTGAMCEKTLVTRVSVFKQCVVWGSWVAQLMEHPTLGLGSGHDLRVVRSSLMWGSLLSMGSV